MKTNRKFIMDDDAVSPVIAVILLVAITVVLAATVWVFVSMSNNNEEPTPLVTCSVQNNNDLLMITNTESGVSWSNIEISTNNANATLNGVAVGTNWTLATNLGQSGEVTAGNQFIVAGTGVSGNVKITFRYLLNNSLIGSWIVNV